MSPRYSPAVSTLFVFDRLNGLTADELHGAADGLCGLLLDRWPDCRIDKVERRAPDHAPEVPHG